MVVDTNFLERPELRTYLAASKENFAVLTDYTAMEAYKPDSLDSIYKRMSVLREFPVQVIILRSTRQIGALVGTAAEISERMIDPEQTAGFPEFCRVLELTEAGDEAVRRQVLRHAQTAREHLEKIRNDSGKLASAISHLATGFSPGDLKIIRRQAERYPAPLLHKVADRIFEISQRLFEAHPNVKAPPRSLAEARDRYLFRAAVCAVQLALRWISVGGADRAKPENLRNDQVDLQFAAVATYFDGLFTNDRKVAAIHAEADVWLERFAMDA